MMFLVYVYGNGQLESAHVPANYKYLIPQMQTFLDQTRQLTDATRVLVIWVDHAVDGVPICEVHVRRDTNISQMGFWPRKEVCDK